MAVASVFNLQKNDRFEQTSPDILTDLHARLHQATKLRSATGDKLPSVQEGTEAKSRYESCSGPLGVLASRAVFSTSTGCWSIIKGRNSKGYVQLYGRKKFGLEPKPDSRDYGIGAHRLAYILKLREAGLPDEIPPGIDIDHICRGTACCNPAHVRGIDKALNNILKDKAHRIESALAVGQLMLGQIGISWFDKNLINAQKEDTGMIVSTRFGPHRIFKLSHEPLISLGKREPCEIFDALLPPAADNRQRKSRAQKPYIDAGQLAIT